MTRWSRTVPEKVPCGFFLRGYCTKFPKRTVFVLEKTDLSKEGDSARKGAETVRNAGKSKL